MAIKTRVILGKEMAAIELMKPNPWNTNIMTPENEAKVRESIKRLGMFKPIIVREKDDKFEILGGQHRWEVLKSDGAVEAPIFNLGKVTDKKAKEIGLADNARYGYDDTLALSELLNQIGTPDEIMAFLPFNIDELTAITSSTSIALDDLGISENDATAELPVRAAPTHQVMRFKVPVGDTAWIALQIEKIMKKENYTSEDAMTNAGNALVHILNQSRNQE